MLDAAIFQADKNTLYIRTIELSIVLKVKAPPKRGQHLSRVSRPYGVVCPARSARGDLDPIELDAPGAVKAPGDVDGSSGADLLTPVDLNPGELSDELAGNLVPVAGVGEAHRVDGSPSNEEDLVLAHVAHEQVSPLPIHADPHQVLIKAPAVMFGQGPRMEDMAEHPLLQNLDSLEIADVPIGIKLGEEVVRPRRLEGNDLLSLVLQFGDLWKIRVEKVDLDHDVHQLAELARGHSRSHRSTPLPEFAHDAP